MRTFVIYARKARTDSKFTLDDLPGSGGKMDTVARFVSSCLWISHDVRRDVVVYAVLNGPSRPPVTIEFSGENIKRVSPDERNVASWIRKALELEDITKDWKYIQEGIRISSKSLQEILKGKYCYVLEEKGEYIENVKIQKDPVFLIGDSIGMPKNEEKFALRNGEKISIGKQVYFASACASVINWILDKEE